MTLLHKCAWFVCNLNTNISIYITFFHWVIIHREHDKDNHSYFNHFSHTMTFVINMLELMISAKPWRMQHFYAPLAFGLR